MHTSALSLSSIETTLLFASVVNPTLSNIRLSLRIVGWGH